MFFYHDVSAALYDDESSTWWRHQMENFPRYRPFLREKFAAQRPVMRSFDAFLDLRSNKWLSKQSWGWWFEMPSRPIWCHSNGSTGDDLLSCHPWYILAPSVDNSWQRQHMGVYRFESNYMCRANMHYLPTIWYRNHINIVMVAVKLIIDLHIFRA